MKLDAGQLRAIMPRAPEPTTWAVALSSAGSEFWIRTPAAAAAFVAQLAHESVELTQLVENLRYSDPVRIARFFRTAFDLDHDGAIEPHEVDAARVYVRQPEQLANRAYAGRLGNGPESSGDGWRYRGRGPIQVTGRANYRDLGARLGLDLEARPELLEQPLQGARSAACFWSRHALSTFAERGDFDAITCAINGPAMAGSAERRAYWQRAQQVLGVTPTKGV